MASESVLREKLATCVRIMNMQGLMGLFGHVSTYQPEKGRIYFSPSRGADKSIVKPDDLVVADLEGKVLDGRGSVPKEWPIHTAVHRARRDVLAVAHLHSPYSTLFAVVRCPYRPVTLQGAIFGDGIPVFKDPRLITTPALGGKVAKLMGKKRAVLLRGHGTVVGARDVEEMLYATMILEDDTRKAAQARPLGKLRVFSPAECRIFESEEPLASRSERAWYYFTQLEARWDRQPTTGIGLFV